MGAGVEQRLSAKHREVLHSCTRSGKCAPVRAGALASPKMIGERLFKTPGYTATSDAFPRPVHEIKQGMRLRKKRLACAVPTANLAPMSTARRRETLLRPERLFKRWTFQDRVSLRDASGTDAANGDICTRLPMSFASACRRRLLKCGYTPFWQYRQPEPTVALLTFKVRHELTGWLPNFATGQSAAKHAPVVRYTRENICGQPGDPVTSEVSPG